MRSHGSPKAEPVRRTQRFHLCAPSIGFLAVIESYNLKRLNVSLRIHRLDFRLSDYLFAFPLPGLLRLAFPITGNTQAHATR